MVYDLKKKELIQGMRGIAILLVIAHHAISNFNTIEQLNNFVKILDMIHVNIFFLISGFLFMKNRNKYERQGFLKFVSKKIKNIFMPYYLLTVLFSLCIKCGFMIPGIRNLLLQKEYFEKNILESIVDPLLFRTPYFTSLWFVYVLFIYFLLAWVHTRRSKISWGGNGNHGLQYGIKCVLL